MTLLPDESRSDFLADRPAAADPTQPAGPTVRDQQRGRRSPLVGLTAALAVGALIGGSTGAGVAYWAATSDTASPIGSGDLPTIVNVNDADEATVITAVAVKASPSVVTISVSASGMGGSGSGVILTEDGYVLTNAHVVTLDGGAGEPQIDVTINDGRVLDATVVGTDPISDLAVIKITDAVDLQPAEFADSDELNVGDTAIAIGAPLGLAGTVTNGIVSALNRSITIASSAAPEQGPEEAPEPESPFDFWEFDVPGQQPTTPSSTISLAVIQTDAAINPGNSGGALLDDNGRVIGINVAIATAGGSAGQSGSIGVGFAIPANLAQRVAEELMADGTATHGLLGASVVDATGDPEADAHVVGALIKEVTAGGAAQAAGLQVGDIVTRFNGVPITGSTDLTAQVRALAAGSQTELTYVRGDDATSVEVTLGEL